MADTDMLSHRLSETIETIEATETTGTIKAIEAIEAIGLIQESSTTLQDRSGFTVGGLNSLASDIRAESHYV